MNVQVMDKSTVAAADGAAAGASGAISGSGQFTGYAGKAAFDQVLQNATNNPIVKSEARKKAETAAAGLVSDALILPMLKQLRRSPWGGEGVFSGGIGEKTFGPQFDIQLADRIAHSPRLGIKNALADRLMKRGTAKPAASNKGLDVHG